MSEPLAKSAHRDDPVLALLGRGNTTGATELVNVSLLEVEKLSDLQRRQVTQFVEGGGGAGRGRAAHGIDRASPGERFQLLQGTE